MLEEGVVQRTFWNDRFRFAYRPGVKAGDYYEESMVQHYAETLGHLKSKPIRILNVAAGHGLSAIVLARLLPRATIVATDINVKATELIKYNADLNGVPEGQIDARTHQMIFDSVRPGEMFDCIIAALPPVPVTLERFLTLDAQTRAHHYPSEWGLGGANGRNLIDKMIESSCYYLNESGILLHVHADFLGTDRTLDLMKSTCFSPVLLSSNPVKLKTTKLTLNQSNAIEQLGFRFDTDADGDKIFYVQTFLGTKRRSQDLL